MHVLLDERKVRNLPLLRVLVEPGYASKVGSTDLEAKSEGIGVRFIPHADERDPELMVVLHAVERPIIRTIIASRFKEAVEFSFPPALDHVFDLPLSVLTGRETDRIVDDPRIVTVDLSFVAVECVPKNPQDAAIRQGDRIRRIGPMPGRPRRKRRGAIEVGRFRASQPR